MDFPYYLDETYQALFSRALHAFADHLAGLPESAKKRIVASQAMYGSTGDDTPWHGTPTDSKYVSPLQVVCRTDSTIRTFERTYV
jgi:hypothetical protein